MKRYALSLILLVAGFIAFLNWGWGAALKVVYRITENPLILIAAAFAILILFGAFFYAISGYLLGDEKSRRESIPRVMLHWTLDLLAQLMYAIGSTVVILIGVIILLFKWADGCSSSYPWTAVSWAYVGLAIGLIALGNYMRSDHFLDAFLDAKEKIHEGADRAMGYNKPMDEWVDARGDKESEIEDGDGTALSTWHSPGQKITIASPPKPRLPKADRPEKDSIPEIPHERPKMISDVRDVLPTLRYLLRENGNREVGIENDPWQKGHSMYVYEKKLLITKEQAPLIRKYLHNLKPGREQDSFFVQNEAGDKDRVIWQGSGDFITMRKQENENTKWHREKAERETRIARGVAEAKAAKKISQPAAIRIEAGEFEKAKRAGRGNDRAAWLNQLLRSRGVEFLSDSPQPDGVYWHYLDRDVQIPVAWYEWFSDDNTSLSSPGFKSISGLSFDWNRYGVADEDSYIQHKLRIW